MPFHTILPDNFRWIPLLVGRGPNPRTQSKMRNMMCLRLCPDVGLLQLSTCSWETALFDKHSPRPSKKVSRCSSFDFSFLSESNLRGTTGVLFSTANQAPQSLSWGSCPVPYSLLASERDHHHHLLQALSLAQSRKHRSCRGFWLPLIDRKSFLEDEAFRRGQKVVAVTNSSRFLPVSYSYCTAR